MTATQGIENPPTTNKPTSKIEIIENPLIKQTNYENDPLDPIMGVATAWKSNLNPEWLTAPHIPVIENPYSEDKNPPKLELGDNIIQGMSGSGVQVVLEFPANDYQSSVYFVAKDILTVSHSVSRSKLPVTNLGEASMSGMSIGSRMVAGSIIKLFSRYDSLSTYVKTFVATRWDKLNEKDKQDVSTTGTSISFKEFSDYMRDDISPFNIHLVNTVETLLPKDYEKDASVPRVSSIIGATIINNGKVFSIENLITEETLSFIAKTVIYSTDNLKPNNYGMTVKGSDLIRGL